MSTQILSQQLSILLSNTYIFSQQLHAFHWVYRGEGFIYLHPFFGDDYQNTYESIDRYAEEILTLNYLPPTRLSEYLSLSTSIKELGDIEAREQMLSVAASGHNALGEIIKSILPYSDECEAHDISNYLAERQAYHYKQAWFYNAELGVKIPDAFKRTLQTRISHQP